LLVLVERGPIGQEGTGAELVDGAGDLVPEGDRGGLPGPHPTMEKSQVGVAHAAAVDPDAGLRLARGGQF
jgi:hypothetical protein